MKILHSQRFWQLVLVAMMVPLALIAFWPSPVDQPVSGTLSAVLNYLHKHGVPHWINYQFVEASANVALFLPLGIAGTLAFSGKTWWQVGSLGLLVSGCIELGQLLFLHDRFSSPVDIMTNTSGAFLGTLLVRLLTKRGGVRRLSATDPSESVKHQD